MPIVTQNGSPTYQYSPVFTDGRYIGVKGYPMTFKGDLSGSDSAMFNYWQQQQQNAYDLELWNLNNQYNTPSAQMARYQQAGLNPNLIYSQQNTSGSPASSSAPIAAKPTNFKAQNTLTALQIANQTLGQMMGVMEGARKIYDYATYGAQGHGFQNTLLGLQANALDVSTRWKQYFEMPLAESKATGKPVQVVTPEGASFSVNWNESLEAQALQALANQRNTDTAVKDFLLNNVYPWQGLQAKYNAQSLQYDTQAKKNALDIYNSIVQSCHIENQYVKALLWKAISGANSITLGDAISLGKMIF